MGEARQEKAPEPRKAPRRVPEPHTPAQIQTDQLLEIGQEIDSLNQLLGEHESQMSDDCRARLQEKILVLNEKRLSIGTKY